MYLTGSYIIQKEPVKAAKVLFYGNKADREVILLDEQGNLLSAYKQVGDKKYMAKSDIASKLTARVNKALTKIRKTGGEPTSFNDIPALEFYSETRNSTVTIVTDRRTVFKLDIDMDVRLTIAMTPDGTEKRFVSPPNIPYVELSQTITDERGQDITVRTVDEIKLTKNDVSWLERVQGIVIQDDERAERYFQKLEEYGGAIAYDTETTGLKINCFGKINSRYAKMLEEYNNTHAEKIYPDRLCGIIFATKTDTAVYFPCFSRKFKTLYQEDTPLRRQIIDRIRSDYTIGRYRDRKGDMADYIRNGGEMTPDIILMERIRYILETKYIVAHNASFEYKVGFMYDIITNVRDDTMLLHQILHRYGPDPRHRQSNLKALSKLELGIDQWGLEDFFPAYKEDDDARLRAKSKVGKKKRKKKSNIDFSYMDLDGARIYAPADGYCTMGLWKKYKKELKEQYSQMERIYLVEVAACRGVAYCEFFGHRLDENKIEEVKQDYIEQTALLESKIRAEAKLCQVGEDELRRKLELARMSDKDAEKLSDEEKKLRKEAQAIGAPQLAKELKELMSMDVFNLDSPKQLAKLFYETMGIPETSKGRSVAKDAIKALLEHKHPDGTLKYPIVKYYQEYKAADTLLTKFFDNLSDYMWPGGYIFSSYGQIAAATGRMSCIAEGELVTLTTGKKPIQDVQVGDIAYCYDGDRHLYQRKVLAVLDQGERECVEIKWAGGSYRKVIYEERPDGTKEYKGTEEVTGTLICTADHLIRVTDSKWEEPARWVKAGDLVEGDLILRLTVGKEYKLTDSVRVLSVTPVGKRHVYDLTIDEHSNFVASDINVHNCKQPNAQQYPKAISKIVIPRDNCVMMDADFSQIEYRVLVALAQEPGLLAKFYDPDIDYHTMMASLMFGVDYAAVTPAMRSDAKRFNFGIPYGMGIGSIAMGLFGENTPKTREMAKAKRKLYFKEQPRVEQFFERVKEAAVVYGYTETAFKRRRYYTFTSSDPAKANAAKAAAMRQAGNAVIQGCLRGDSKILTKEYGYISIGALADLPVTVWDGTKYVSAWVRPSGVKKEYEVKLTDGNTIYTSANHGFWTTGTKGKFDWREAKVLSGQRYFAMTEEAEDWVSNDLMLPKVADSKAHNSRNHSMADIKDDYERGLLAGHLAGDGSVTGDTIQCLVAEHEKEYVLPVLESILGQFGPYSVRVKKSGLGTQMMYYISLKSKRLATELKEADIKNRIPLFVWNSKETLRGYLKARFDSDGTVNEDNVILTLGRGHEREPLAKDIQQALYLFGIHSRLHYCADRINVTIRKKHVALYRDRIGFINPAKQSKLKDFEVIEKFKTFGQDVVRLDSVRETGEEVEMFDVVDSESSQFMANGLVTHNTAADIFKIALARSMKFIIDNDLFGKVFLTNMVHDELLWEIDASQVNPLVVTVNIGKMMSFPLDGYPPLFIGAGVSDCWAKAKSKDCEIHPHLLQLMTEEVEEKKYDLHTPTMSPKEWVAYFDNRVMEFRKEKILQYLTDPANFGQNVHPEIGNLIRLLYLKHIDESGINPKDPGADAERTLRCIEYLAKELGLELDRNNYMTTGVQVAADDTEDHEYEDGDAEGVDDGFNTSDSDFELVDEDKVSGVRLVDLIREFEYVVAPSLGVCGIDDSILTQKQREDVYGFLLEHKQCGPDDEGALELVLHIGGGVLRHTGVYVHNIGTGAELEDLMVR